MLPRHSPWCAFPTRCPLGSRLWLGPCAGFPSVQCPSHRPEPCRHTLQTRASKRVWAPIHPTAHRDVAELAKHGITAAMLTRFDADTAALGAMDPDTVLVQEGKVVADDKDATEVLLETTAI